MAAKSILNELYQRLRTAAPVYKTQADGINEGFVCTLTLPAVECDYEALAVDRCFQGSGASKKEAEHAAANAAVECLTEEKVLRTDAAPTASHSSRCTPVAAIGGPSPTVSSATSGVTESGVGSKRSKSSADYDEESNESLELRILETLAAVYPRTLNGAQLAKMCGHFKLKSKVNHLLYMKLRVSGQVEMLDSHPPAWRATPQAAGAPATAVSAGPAATTAPLQVTTDAAITAPGLDHVQTRAAAAAAGAGQSHVSQHTWQHVVKHPRGSNLKEEQLMAHREQQQQQSMTRQRSGRFGGSLGLPPAVGWTVQQQQQWGPLLAPASGQASLMHGMHAAANNATRWHLRGPPAAAAAAAARAAPAPAGRMTLAGHPQQQQQHSQQSYSRSFSQGGTLSQSYSQPSHSNTLSCGQSTTAATAAAARLQEQQLAAAGLAALSQSGLSGGVQAAGGAAVAAVDADTDDDDISPAVLAAASEAASLEPAPFAAQPASDSARSGTRQQQQLDLQQQLLHAGGMLDSWQAARSGVADASANHQSLQQRVDIGSMLPHLDLLAAMQLNEQPLQQQEHQLGLEGYDTCQGSGLGVESAAAMATAAANVEVASPAAENMRARPSNRPQLEAGTKRKYPAFSSTADAGGANKAAAAVAGAGAPNPATASEALCRIAAGVPAPGVHAHAQTCTAVPQLIEGHFLCGQHQEQQQQLWHDEQQQGLSQFADQQLDQTHSVEHQQPQRRRRRSGRGLVGPAAAVAAGGSFGLERADSTSHSVAAAVAAHQECSDDEISSEDMQASAGVAAGSSPLSAPDHGAAAGAAADLAAALVHLSAGPSQQHQQHYQQQQQLLSSPGMPTGHRHTASPAAAAAPALIHQGGGDGEGSGLQWDPHTTWIHGAVTNPWQLQWQGQRGLGLLGGNPAVPPSAAADSEGIGSCLGWPAAVSTGLQQQQQQPQSPTVQGLGQQGFGPLHRQLSPSPSPSVLSIGASSVVGPRVRPSPGQLAAAAPSGTATEGGVAHVDGSHGSFQQPVHNLHMDFRQSEEQALQLLSRLALPGPGAAAPPDATDAIRSATAAAAGPDVHKASAGGAAADDCIRTDCDGVFIAAPQQHVADTVTAAQPGSIDAERVDSLSLAVAAAAAAAKAAAAIAAAASFAPGPGQTCFAAKAAAGKQPALAVPSSSNSIPSTTENASEPDCNPHLQQSGQRQQQTRSASAAAYSSQLGDILTAAQGLVIASNSQQVADATAMAVVTGAVLNRGAADADQPGHCVHQGKEGAVSTPSAARALGVMPSVELQQDALQPQQQQISSTHLQEEYERRMFAVRDLVQQLNDALQGLNSIREQAERQ